MVLGGAAATGLLLLELIPTSKEADPNDGPNYCRPWRSAPGVHLLR